MELRTNPISSGSAIEWKTETSMLRIGTEMARQKPLSLGFLCPSGQGFPGLNGKVSVCGN